jgi:hypothetical protein
MLVGLTSALGGVDVSPYAMEYNSVVFKDGHSHVNG